MYSKELKNNIQKLTNAEKEVFNFTIIITLTIIALSKTLFQTSFGRASMTYRLVSLSLITMLRIPKIWRLK